MLIPSDGGLDLTEDKLLLQPGTLQLCRNYEVAYRKGYSRQEGMVRWDGREITPDDMDGYRDLVQQVPGGPAYGLVWHTDRATLESWLYAVVESTQVVVKNLAIASADLRVTGQRVEFYTDTPTGIPNAWLLDPGLSIPGESAGTTMEVLIEDGVTLLGSSMVAYSRVEIQSGQLADLAVGDQIYDDVTGWTATVRGIQELSGSAMTTDLSAYLWVEIDTPGAVVEGSGLQRVSDDEAVGVLVAVIGYSENGVLVGSGISPSVPDATENRGTLIRSSGSGWEATIPAWEVRFVDGANQPADIFANGGKVSANEDFGGLAPAQALAPFWDDSGGSTEEWDKNDDALQAAIASDDANFAESTIPNSGWFTHDIQVKDFADELDPLDEPTGISIEIICEKISGTRTVFLDRVRADNGVRRGEGIELTNAVRTSIVVGGEQDKWGAASSAALADIINDPNFGWRIRFGASGAGQLDNTVRVYMVRRTVHLREGSSKSVVYLHKDGNDVEARIINTYTDFGTSWDDGTATGYLTLLDVPDPGAVPVGASIYTGAGQSGDLICNIEGGLEPIRLPSRAQMAEKQSQFEWLETNFYAAARLSAVYGVSGADTAFTFNSNYLIRIRTGRTEDEPRHLAKFGARMALGYENGDADVSISGDPRVFDGVLGAFSFGFGSRVTGMLQLDGETLGVWTEDSIYGIQAATAVDAIQQTLSEDTGGREYTVRMVAGMPMFLDARGLSMLGSSAKYGDFESGRLSKAVRSYLVPRLSAGAGSGIRPILAEVVKKKSQYRIWFEDGEVLTLTWLEDRVPRWTIQKPYLEAGEAPLTILATALGVDGDDEAYSFASFAESNYVQRLHYGSDFDGQAITARIEYNPVHANGPGKNLRLNTVHIHGVTSGLAELQTQIGVNYGRPAGYVCITQFGEATLTEERPVFAKCRHRARGRDFALAVETETFTPHTIQVLEFPNLSNRKLKR